MASPASEVVIAWDRDACSSEQPGPDAPFEQMFSTARVRDSGGAGRLLDRQSRRRRSAAFVQDIRPAGSRRWILPYPTHI